jgi:flagellar motility protein MotE (MotC chaperone)
MVAIPSAIGLLIGLIYSYSLADIILFSDSNKVLAILSIGLFLVLPIVGFIVWIIRRIAGFRSSSKLLRITFIGLNIVGWVATILLIASLANDNKTYSTSRTTMNVDSPSDTLYVNALDTTTTYAETFFYEFNEFEHLIDKKQDVNEIKAVRLHYEQSNDSVIKIVIEKSGAGANKMKALGYANAAEFVPQLNGNVLKMPHFIQVDNNVPYHFQNVLVTIYYPKNKTIIVSSALKKQLSHSFKADKHGLNINIDDNDEDWNNSPNQIISVNEDTIKKEIDEAEKNETIKEVKQQLEEVNKQNIELIKEKQKELEELQKEANKDIEKAKKELDEAIKQSK